MSAVRRRDLREGALARRSARGGGRFIGAFGGVWCCRVRGRQVGTEGMGGEGCGGAQCGRCDPSNSQMGCATLKRFG